MIGRIGHCIALIRFQIGKGFAVQHIIVVDDLAADRLFLAEGLSRPDLMVHSFESGSALFEALDVNPELGRAKAIILDVVMPDSDGIEILKELARLGVTIPVILVSGIDSKILETTSILGSAWSIDIAASLQKPVQLTEIAEILDRL